MLSENEYDLYISRDTNSDFYSQWFYFSVENANKDQVVKFTVWNYSKPTNLFKNGMKPAVFSLKDFYERHTGWDYSTENVEFKKTSIENLNIQQRIGFQNAVGKLAEGDETKNFYNLSFTYHFKNTSDKVYFALLQPYSFSRIYTFIRDIESELRERQQLFINAKLEKNRSRKKVKKKKKCTTTQPIFRFETENLLYTRDLLCYTNLGLPVDFITINSKEKNPHKKFILITARVHAAETPGSIKLEYILRTLIYQSTNTLELLKNFTFIIIPILNPDGVVLGNTRTCFEGYDLNRCWSAPDKFVHVPIFHLKKALKQIYKANKEIYLFCDLHGHGKLPNSFIYACNRAIDGDFSSWTKIRLLPKIIAKYSKFFSYSHCQFKVEAGKRDTGRIVLWKEFGVMNSFTFETSIFGYTDADKYIRYNEEDIKNLSEAFIRALCEYTRLMRELGKEMIISKAYNYLYDQVDKSAMDKFPLIEIKDKKPNGKIIEQKDKLSITKTDLSKLEPKEKEIKNIKFAEYNISPKSIEMHSENLKNRHIEEDILDAMIDMSDNYDIKHKPKAKPDNSIVVKKLTVKSKVMNFGGGLASLKPIKEKNCISTLASCKDSKEYNKCELLQSNKYKDIKPLENIIFKFQKQMVKRHTSLSTDEVPSQSHLKKQQSSMTKCLELIVTSEKCNTNAIEAVKQNNDTFDKGRNLRKLKDIDSPPDNSMHPSFIYDDTKMFDNLHANRGGCIFSHKNTRNIMHLKGSQQFELKDADTSKRFRGYSLRKFQ